tara:strand:- start:83 stop:316 length:234 start_codon:yes stop_codon:yes gene_type:complete
MASINASLLSATSFSEEDLLLARTAYKKTISPRQKEQLYAPNILVRYMKPVQYCSPAGTNYDSDAAEFKVVKAQEYE